MDIDAVLEQIASELEEPNFLDLQGILAKTKRKREDADLRMRTRQEQRKEIARWVRSFKTGNGNAYTTTLERIQGHPFAFGPDIAAALAARHATLNLSLDLDTSLENCRAKYTVKLTDAGRAAIDRAVAEAADGVEQVKEAQENRK